MIDSTQVGRVRAKGGFTLIELLVVIAIVAVLVALVLPAISKSRLAAQTAVSMSNLKQCGVIQFSYGNDSKESFVNPFGANLPGQPVPGDYLWYDVVAPAPSIRATGSAAVGWRWSFDDSGWHSEMFSALWLSLMNHYIDGRALYSNMLYAPNDAPARARLAATRARVLANTVTSRVDGNLEGWAWDTSYFYSPTFWLSPERYRTSSWVPLRKPKQLDGLAYWRRNRFDDVRTPAAKVMIFERMDFSRMRRTGKGGKTEAFSPTFNNPEATTYFTTADGSVDSIKMSRVHELTNPARARREDVDVFTPSGTWNVPDNVLGDPFNREGETNSYMMGRDGLENGDGVLTYGVLRAFNMYDAFFWATRNGVQGRDVPR